MNKKNDNKNNDVEEIVKMIVLKQRKLLFFLQDLDRDYPDLLRKNKYFNEIYSLSQELRKKIEAQEDSAYEADFKRRLGLED